MRLTTDERQQLEALRSRAEAVDPVVALHGLDGRLREDPELALDSLADRVHDALRSASTTVSLDAPVGADDALVIADLIPDARDLVDEVDNVRQVIARIWSAAPKLLTRRQVAILRMRYGAADGRERKFDEIARKLDSEADAVRRGERRALRRLRRAPEIHALVKSIARTNLAARPEPHSSSFPPAPVKRSVFARASSSAGAREEAPARGSAASIATVPAFPPAQQRQRYQKYWSTPGYHRL